MSHKGVNITFHPISKYRLFEQGNMLEKYITNHHLYRSLSQYNAKLSDNKGAKRWVHEGYGEYLSEFEIRI